MRYFLPLIFLLAACSPAPTATVLLETIPPSATPLPSPTFTPNVLVIIETPVPTSTPFAYVIQSGDTFSELAEKFKVSQDALREANPDIQPNSMGIGQTILIPDPASLLPSGATSTPAPVPVTQTICHPTADGGAWCFALLQNNTADYLGNVSAQVTLFNVSGETVASQSAFLPLDILPPNTSLPVFAFFPGAPADATMQIQILSAVPSNGAGYLSASLNNIVTQIGWNGLTAKVSGEIYLPAESKAATQTRIAAVAYDKGGQVTGLKIWDGGSMQPGEKAVFSFQVASLGAAIDRVEYVIQSR
jgi:murein DD-endopeptidase MepM/ murein hydrolase activator NlpD